MIKFCVLGSTILRRGDGNFDHSFLAGSKRLALFTYLILARPYGYRRRDKLVALFWPERGQKSARNALSNMLYHIREALGKEVLVNRGTEEIRINREKVRCDAVAFEKALDKDNPREALKMYRGDLLPGFHMPENSNKFMSWLDAERERLRQRAADAAWMLAEEAEQDHKVAMAREWANKAVSLMGLSEDAYRRLIKFLIRIGDQSGALKAYKEFETLIREEWGMEPNDKLKALVNDIDRQLTSEGYKSMSPVHHQESGSTETVAPDNSYDRNNLQETAEPEVADWSSLLRPRPVTSLWWAAVTGLLLLLTATGWMLWPDQTGRNNGASGNSEQSVAVLPFTYLGAEDSTDYFSLGMTEEILSRLAQVSDLSVISRTSVMQYRDTEKSLRDIAQELGVAAVVEGSVQQAGGRVRIHAQLIDAETDHHLWSKRYDREFRNIFSIQSDIAKSIAGELEAELLPQEQAKLTARHDVDETAYHLYLRAQYLRDQRDPAQMSRAAALYREAITHDSTFASAHAGLAMASFWLGNIGMMDPDLAGAEGVPPKTAGAEALQAADRAIVLDSTVAEAHLAKALVYERFQRDWDRSRQAFQRILHLNPSHSEAREDYGWHLLRLGHADSAIVQMKRAVALDPFSSGAHHSLGYAYHINRQYEEAIQEMETALDLGSGDPFTKKFLNVALIKQSQQLFREGRDKEAEAHLDRAEEMMDAIWGKNNERRAIFDLALRGQRAEALQQLKQASLANGPTTYIFSLTGQSEPILEMLEYAARHRDSILSFRVCADPIFDPARDHPQRFDRIVEQALGHDVDLP